MGKSSRKRVVKACYYFFYADTIHSKDFPVVYTVQRPLFYVYFYNISSF